MNLMINGLPTRTWNRLGMNETRVTADTVPGNHTPEAVFDPEQISWTAKAASDEAPLRMGTGEDLNTLTAQADLGVAETRPGVVMTEPIKLRYAYGSAENGASRLSLHAGRDSCLSALLLLTDDGVTDSGLSVLQTRIQADAGARVDLFVVQLLGAGRTCLQDISGVCGENATINLTKLELGAGTLYAGSHIDLLGRCSHFNAEIGYHVLPGQTLDMNYVALHHGEKTESEIEVNGTLEEGARKLFRGTIDFQQGCRGAKGTENETVLLMGDEMVNQTIPLILCKEEDVEGNHGASIGRLDEKVLFYLSTRGIPQEQAQRIIARSRIEAICGKIPDETVADLVHEFEDQRGDGHEPEL